MSRSILVTLFNKIAHFQKMSLFFLRLSKLVKIIFHEFKITAAPRKQWRHSASMSSLFKQVPLSPPVPYEAAQLSSDVLQARCLTLLRVSPALQLWPEDPLHPQSPSSLRLTTSPAAADAPA